MIKKVVAAATLAGGLLLTNAGLAAADAGAQGAAVGDPGFLSGNVLQVPLNIPINACGNTIDVIGLLNPAFGNACGNVHAPSNPPRPVAPRHHHHHHPAPAPAPAPVTPPPPPPPVTPSHHHHHRRMTVHRHHHLRWNHRCGPGWDNGRVRGSDRDTFRDRDRDDVLGNGNGVRRDRDFRDNGDRGWGRGWISSCDWRR